MRPARVAILTPDPADRDFKSRWRDVFERTATPLRNERIEVEARSWAEAEDLDRFDLVLPLLVWGYHRAGPAWAEATRRWEGAGVRLRNPAEVLRWNSDKLYLQRLAERGAPVVPTLFVDRIDAETMAAAARHFSSDRLVAKPQVSASAWQTIKWSPGDRLEGGPDGKTMIQPFFPSIEKEGEISLIYVDGRLSHAISKRPQPGDFRVQPEYDGIIAGHRPADDERDAGEAILAAIDEQLLYARIDLVRDEQGQPRLMEAELVEPDLYLEYDSGGGGAFANAVAGAALDR